MTDIKSLAHSKWRCQYHIVFAPKYRRQEVYSKIKADIGQILRKLCEQKGVEIIEAQACPDHIHMLVSIPPSLSCSAIHGIPQGEKQLDDLRPTRKLEVQIWKSALLVQGILCGYGRTQ